jgi:hypothetical protein
MHKIGKTERETQNRIVSQLSNSMGYEYLGNWEELRRNQPIIPAHRKCKF